MENSNEIQHFKNQPAFDREREREGKKDTSPSNFAAEATAAKALFAFNPKKKNKWVIYIKQENILKNQQL